MPLSSRLSHSSNCGQNTVLIITLFLQFTAILKHVHGYALQKILQEHAKLPAQGAPSGPSYPACGCSIQQSIGLPYYHKIWQRKLSDVIHLEDIHQHWYCSRPEPGAYSQLNISHLLPVLNPLPVQGKARPRGGLGGIVRPTNTRRLPSAFELPSSSAPPTVSRPSEHRALYSQLRSI
jgi:hypothetical protein